MKIKKGDTVKVIAGKDKDKEGKVIAVDTKNNKVLVEGVNMVTKHTKPSAWLTSRAESFKQEAYIDVSNVMYLHKGNSYKSWIQDGRRQKSSFCQEQLAT